MTGIIVIIIIVVIIARFTGVTRTIEFFMGDEGAQVIEANVAGPTITRPGLAGIQALFRWRWRRRRRRRIFAFLLDFAGNRRRRWRQIRRRRRLRAFSYLRFAVHLYLRGNFLRRSRGRGFRCGQRRLIIQYARYIIFFLKRMIEVTRYSLKRYVYSVETKCCVCLSKMIFIRFLFYCRFYFPAISFN